ncbi:MAG: biotin--[acetyl-CoA-carboxylase] ligase [Thermoplasmata archaeon]|nr:biotin--[acetyl-CoA-carboxylase] ligase [Thermoplasmata archaeon]
MTEILRFARIASTQREAVSRARAGAPPGTTVIAAVQAHGVGRLDRAWASPAGGLYLSRIESDPGGPVELIPMAIALELAEWLDRSVGVFPSIRWPNDLWLHVPSGKIAGVLADRVRSPSGDRLVLGIGVNVAQDRADLPTDLAASVAILQERTSRSVPLEEVERAVLKAVQHALERVVAPRGPELLVRAVERRLEGIGAQATLDGAPVGEILGLDPTGALETRLEGTRSVHRAGTLRFVPIPIDVAEPRRLAGVHKMIKADPGPPTGAGTK